MLKLLIKILASKRPHRISEARAVIKGFNPFIPGDKFHDEVKNIRNNIDEIPEFDRYAYEEVCVCGKNHVILTQNGNFPEYETEVYVLCECGKYVEFILPVN